jgi:hypothetical protein
MSDRNVEKTPELSRFIEVHGLMYYRHFEPQKIPADRSRGDCRNRLGWLKILRRHSVGGGVVQARRRWCGTWTFFPPEETRKKTILRWVLRRLVDKLRKDEFFAGGYYFWRNTRRENSRTFQGSCGCTNSEFRNVISERMIDLKTFQREHKPFALL